MDLTVKGDAAKYMFYFPMRLYDFIMLNLQSMILDGNRIDPLK